MLFFTTLTFPLIFMKRKPRLRRQNQKLLKLCYFEKWFKVDLFGNIMKISKYILEIFDPGLEEMSYF